MPGDDWRARLNLEQQRAVDHDAGPLIVLAGPGTGKTRVIIARICRLIEQGAEPESILAVTFSVKAAVEMRERLAEALGPRTAERVHARTFHSLGRSILARFGDMIGARSDPVLVDSAQRIRLARDLASAHRLFTDSLPRGIDNRLRTALAFVDACRHAARTPGDALTYSETLLAAAHDDPARAIARDVVASARFYALYEDACFDRGWVSFENFLTLPLRIVRERPIAAKILQAEIRHLLVDEFQDVNAAQIELLRALAPPRNDAGRPPDLCVVGDDDQAIYAFRGAAPDAFVRFAAIYPRHHTIALEHNYRAAHALVEISNATIARADHRFQPDKRLVAATPDGSPPLPGVVEGVTADDRIAGSVIAAMILEDRARNPARRWADYAVIARKNAYRDEIAASLDLDGIPVDNAARPTPADDDAVKDLLAWLRLLADPADNSAAQRLLVRPPHSLDVLTVNDWRRAHERAAIDHAITTPFVDWLLERHGPDSPRPFPELRDFFSLLATLRHVASTSTADRIVERIVHETGIAEAEDLDPRDRARRILDLVQVIRFVRSRQPHIDPPGDAAAFSRYYLDLSPNEQHFAVPGLDAIDHSGPDEEPDSDAVRVITAHGAKGLEFDTVFVTRVRPRNGFPSSEKDDDRRVELPQAFTGLPEPDHDDEERRIFYVACTRARRRLVLLAKPKKTTTKTIDYFDELTKSTLGLRIPVTDAAVWLDRAGTPPPDPLDRTADTAGTPAARRESMVRREIRALRQSAFAALRQAEAAGAADDPAALDDSRRRLESVADTIAALARLRARGDPPAPLPHAADEPLIAKVAARLRDASSPAIFRPMPPPLLLSYSAINDYLRCPRCFYLKHVLHLDEPPSLELEIGNIVHAALHRFVAERSDAENDGRPAPDRDRLLAIAGEIYRRDWPPSRPFDLAPLRQIDAQLALMLDTLEDNAESLFLEQRVDFPYEHDALTHRMIAKYDRVDRLSDGRWRIVDYKTGQPRAALLEPPADDLQFGIYLIALPHLLALPAADRLQGTAEYWILSTGQRGSISLEDIDLAKVRQKIADAASGMLAGSFPRGKQKTCRGHCAILGPFE
jgi:DNA helicase-2/ATP-dependent DNA helicase PcrA